MIYDHVDGIRDSLKQDLAFEFWRNQNKGISILTGTHISHDEIHNIKNNCLGPIFFSPGKNHTKGMLFLLHLAFEGITEVDTDTKGRFVSFKVNPSNDRVLFVYVHSGYNTKAQLAGGVSLKDYNIIWEIKKGKRQQIKTWRL